MFVWYSGVKISSCRFQESRGGVCRLYGAKVRVSKSLCLFISVCGKRYGMGVGFISICSPFFLYL